MSVYISHNLIYEIDSHGTSYTSVWFNDFLSHTSSWSNHGKRLSNISICKTKVEIIFESFIRIVSIHYFNLTEGWLNLLVNDYKHKIKMTMN